MLRFLLLLIFSPLVWALTPMTEEDMSDATGQAFVAIDRSTQGSVDYTKVSLGLEVSTLLDIGKLELGKYNRAGEEAGSADILIDNFALGHIDSNGNIVPFEIVDPFIELAFDRSNGREDLVGFRIGFGDSFGKLSGDIKYLTGNVDISLYGTGTYLASQMNCAWWDVVCGGAKLLVNTAWASSEFNAQAELVHGTGANRGQRDPVRAQYVGIPNGQSLNLPGGSSFSNFLLGIFKSDQCSLLSTQTCFPIGNYRTLDIGNPNNGQPSKGMFLSFQSKNVNWYDDGQATTATKGAFMNIPNGSVYTSFPDAFQGIPRVRTRYVDPYF